MKPAKKFEKDLKTVDIQVFLQNHNLTMQEYYSLKNCLDGYNKTGTIPTSNANIIKVFAFYGIVAAGGAAEAANTNSAEPSPAGEKQADAPAKASPVTEAPAKKPSEGLSGGEVLAKMFTKDLLGGKKQAKKLSKDLKTTEIQVFMQMYDITIQDYRLLKDCLNEYETGGNVTTSDAKVADVFKKYDFKVQPDGNGAYCITI